MKIATLVGSIIGAAIGAAVWFGLETGSWFGLDTVMRPRDASWAPILIGLLTGLGARLVAQPVSLPFARGAVTALIALAVMFGARQLITYIVNQEAKVLAQKTPVVRDVLEEDTVDEEAMSPDAVMEESVTEEAAADETPAEGEDITLEEEAAEEVVEESAPEEALQPGTVESGIEAMDDRGRPGPADVRPPVPKKQVPTTGIPKPGIADQPWLIGAYFAIGTILAYFLGKGPALGATPPPASASASAN